MTTSISNTLTKANRSSVSYIELAQGIFPFKIRISYALPFCSAKAYVRFWIILFLTLALFLAPDRSGAPRRYLYALTIIPSMPLFHAAIASESASRHSDRFL